METLELTWPETPGRFSTYLAIGSFTIGTILLALHLYSRFELNIVLIGLYYIILAFVLNAMTLLYLFYHFIVNKAERQVLAIRILILLANIPIAFMYFLIFISAPI